jgi:hypothetical protein
MSVTVHPRVPLHVAEDLIFQNLKAPRKYCHHHRRRRRRRNNNNNNNNNNNLKAVPGKHSIV